MEQSFETKRQEEDKRETIIRRLEVPYAKGWTFGNLYDKLSQDGVLEGGVSIIEFYTAIRTDQELPEGHPNQEKLFIKE